MNDLPLPLIGPVAPHPHFFSVQQPPAAPPNRLYCRITAESYSASRIREIEPLLQKVKMDPDGTFPPVPTSDTRTSDKFKLIAQGPTPDLTITSTTHIKVDANNNMTVDVEKGPVIKCSK